MKEEKEELVVVFISMQYVVSTLESNVKIH